MNEFISSIILGIVQGLTEFLPVSSTGHLIIARDVLGLPLAGSLSFDAVLQLATSFSILIYFRKEIFGLIVSARNFLFRRHSDPLPTTDYRLLTALILGTIPAVIAGLFLEDYMDTVFRSVNLVATILIVGSIIFW